jgi:HlyD family secretion protein
MKRKIITGAVLAILLAALTGIIACSGSGGNSGGTTQQVVNVTRGDLTIGVSGDGSIQTSKEARLNFTSGGKISKIVVNAGDKVKNGDVLAKLDTGSLELALQQAQMGVTQAQGTLLQAQWAQKSAENILDNLKNSGNSLQLALLNAQIARDTAHQSLVTGVAAVDFTELDARLNRAKTWYDYVKKQVGQALNIDQWMLALDSAKEAVDSAQAAYDNALAGYDSSQVNLKKQQLQAAELSVTLAQKNIDDLEKNVAIQEMQAASVSQATKQAQQSLDLAKNSLANAQKQLDEAIITAPFDGVVAAVTAKEGDMLPSPSVMATTVIQLVNPANLQLVIEVDEIDIPSVKQGQDAEVKVDALQGVVFKGKVVSIYPVPVESGGIVLYNVKLAMDVPESSGVKIGMSATADIIAARHQNVLIVPSRAITSNAQGQKIVKVKTDEATQEKVVVVGLDDGISAEIVSGVSQNEKVLVETKVKSSSGASLFGG